MSTYYQDANTTILHGDCIEVMRTMPDNSIDSIVTDPPYGLGFMGKKWDALPPGEDWARECLRVLKPGGHLLAFGGSRTWHRLAVAIEDGGFEIRDSIFWIFGSGFPKHRAGLKPASEPIVMARKPFKGSLVSNEAIHGTGALNIDATRIAGEGAEAGRTRHGGGIVGAGSSFELPDDRSKESPAGRWPANVLLDEHTAELLDEQSGNINGSGHKNVSTSNGPTGKIGPTGLKVSSARPGENTYSDKGGASRFFYVAKAPKRERPNVDGVQHPTVKPIALMRWLCKLVTPPNGIVLDPFAGSGTTIEAALIEGYNSIGIERETEYLPLIQHRINRANGETP